MPPELEEALLIYRLCQMWNLTPTELMEQDVRLLEWTELIGLAKSDGE